MDQFVRLENFKLIAPYAELFWQGMLVTILLALFTVVIGFCLALILALMRMSNVRPFRALGLDAEGGDFWPQSAVLIPCPLSPPPMWRFCGPPL